MSEGSLEDPRVAVILDAIRAIAKRKGGGVLHTNDYDEYRRLVDDTLPSKTTVYRLFPGGWGEAVALAGISSTQEKRARTSDDDMYEALRRCAKDIGSSVISTHVYNSWRKRNEAAWFKEKGRTIPSSSVIRKWHDDKWDRALAAAGLEAPQRSAPKRPEPSQILQALHKAQQRVVEPLTPPLYSQIVSESGDTEKWPDIQSIFQQFPNWEAAMRAASIEVPDDLHPTALWTAVEAQRILKHVHALLKPQGKRVTQETYEDLRSKAKRPMPSWQVLLDLVGTSRRRSQSV